jgi:hypothetical protein
MLKPLLGTVFDPTHSANSGAPVHMLTAATTVPVASSTRLTATKRRTGGGAVAL